MFGLSGEHIILFVVLLFIFGPSQLPKIGSTLGKTARNLKNSLGGEKDAQFRKLREYDAK